MNDNDQSEDNREIVLREIQDVKLMSIFVAGYGILFGFLLLMAGSLAGPKALITGLVHMALGAVVYYLWSLIYLHKNWARWLLIMLVVIVDALAIYCIVQLAEEIGEYIYLTATILLLSIYALLLNKPAVRQWCRITSEQD